MTAPLPLIEGKCKCQQRLKEKRVPGQEQAVADEKKRFQAAFTEGGGGVVYSAD